MDEEQIEYAAIPLSKIKPRKPKYLWWPYLPIGFITTVTGESGIGKTMVLIDIAARLTRGRAMPCIGDDDEQVPRRGSVLFTNQEDPVATVIRPRLEAAGADLDRVHLPTIKQRRRIFDPEDHPNVIERLDVNIHELEKLIVGIGDVRLLIIDPITAFLGKLDFNREDHARKLLRPLAAIASKHKIAVVIVIHMTKESKKKATQRILGSGAFVSINRSTLFVVAPDGSDRRLLIIAKNNNLSPEERRKAVEFTMEDVDGRPRICWGTDYEDDVDLNAILAGRGGARVSKLDQAIFLIREHLAEGDRPRREFDELAKKHGIHIRTFKNAKKMLGVLSVKHGGGAWFWSLAEGNNTNERPRIKRERLEREDKGTRGKRRERLEHGGEERGKSRVARKRL